MKVAPADVFDRVTILILHILHGHEGIEGSGTEYQAFMEELQKLSPPTYQFIQLLGYNRAIWKLESDIRAGKEKELGLKEVGERALKIRDLNKERIRIKNELSKLFGGFHQIKFDHASA